MAKLYTLAAAALMLPIAIAAAPGRPAGKGVPDSFRGVWGLKGRCDVAKDRLTIKATTAAFAGQRPAGIAYDGGDHQVRWTEEGNVDSFELGPKPGVLIHHAQGGGMPAGDEGYARCGAFKKRVAWPPR